MRPRIFSAACLAAVALGVSACGSEERDLIDRAVKAPVRNADASLVVRLTDRGTDVMRFAVTGPYHSNGPTAIPDFDLRMALTVSFAGTEGRIPLRAIGNGKNIFVLLGGDAYELGERRYDELNRESATSPQADDLSDLERAGIDLAAWFPDADVVEDTTLDGEAVKHLEGRLDVSAMLGNLAELLDSPAARKSLGVRQGALSPGVIDEIDKAITDPRLDVFVGEEDGAFRRIAGSLGIEVPGLSPQAKLALQLDLRNLDEVNVVEGTPQGPYKGISELELGFERALERAFGANATT